MSTREASTIVRVGRMSAASSAIERCRSSWNMMRSFPVMPIQFLRPQVTPVSSWCLATGTLITLVAMTNGSRTSQVPRRCEISTVW